jgi:hypothetical protein
MPLPLLAWTLLVLPKEYGVPGKNAAAYKDDDIMASLFHPQPSHRKVCIGVDFDNTLVCYDRVFHAAALELGLISRQIPESKNHVRDALRRTGKEECWTELQGLVYGMRMKEATPFPGVLDFFAFCREHHIPVFIISHKTHHPIRGPKYDLHLAAMSWLESHGFFDPQRLGLDLGAVLFQQTRQGKLTQIDEAGCSHFIDDLPEFLSEPAFPQTVHRILFDPEMIYEDRDTMQHLPSWHAVRKFFVQLLMEDTSG